MRLGDTIFHSKRIVTDGVVTYETPVEYVTKFNYINVQPAKSSSNSFSTEEYGEHAALGWNIIVNARIFKDTFNVGDLLWLDGETPSDGNANGVITTVQKQNIGHRITVKSLEGEY